MRRPIWFCLIIFFCCSPAFAGELVDVSIKSSLDQSQQPAFVYLAEDVEAPVPLLVLLHTWSGDYKQKSHIQQALTECQQRGWALVFPNFRGPNWTPQACGSPLSVQDVIDAVEWVKKQRAIDQKRIYLTGVSGGGHMSMLMVGKHPEVWAGVSAWVGISDLAAWHAETKAAGRNYYKHIEKAVGGPPGASQEVDQQLRERSPLTWLHRAQGVAIDLNAGIQDGHTGSVPISHSLNAFNLLAKANDEVDLMIDPAQIKLMTGQALVPEELRYDGETEKRAHTILFRRVAGPARITLFDGGHEGDIATAVEWLSQQTRKSH